MATPVEDLQDYINANEAALTTADNLFIGPVEPTSSLFPAECVFLLPTGGISPQGFVGMDTYVWFNDIQIRIRWTKKRFWDGYTLARRLRALLHYAPIADTISVLVRESEPNYIGEDDEGNPEWSLNVTMEKRE